ncbi:hypothetical protein HUU53_04350 [Candidatus Micrarchaeota archaeon]|nr:hypothetical protein [Candidatus Micrarchaeota archaeon]
MLYYAPPTTFVNTLSGNYSLDCSSENVFVSHAHSDHLPSFKQAKKVIASQETIDLVKVIKKKEVKAQYSSDLELLNSGHVLGGKMLYAQGDGATALYTGDFKTSDSLTMKGAKPKECDYLLVESTYGLPQYSFPSRESVYEEVSSWVNSELKAGKIVLLGGYSLGKSQEIIKLLNDYCKVAPIVTSKIAELSRVYNKHGVKLDFLESGSVEAEEELTKGFVSIIPMHKANRALAENLQSFYGRKVSVATCSGWNLYSNSFCLSDHCDFNELIEFVEACNPKKVIVNHGFSEEFAASLRGKGFNAVSLEKSMERTLMEFV